MDEEIDCIEKNQTWELTPISLNLDLLGNIWINAL